MRTNRTLITVLAIGAVLAAFVGVSAALEGEDQPTLVGPPAVETPDCTMETTDATDATEDGTEDLTEDLTGTGDDPSVDDPCLDETDGDDGIPDDEDDASEDETTEDEVSEDEATGADDLDDGGDDGGDAADQPENHGAAVSEAARTCPPGPEHGPCVRDVARSDAGKPGHTDADESEADEPDEPDEPDDTAVDDTTPDDDQADQPGGPAKGPAGKDKGRGRG